MKFLDLFAGVGGFRRGMELAGHKCVGFCEWDKFAAASYISMHLITEEQRSRLKQLDLKARQKEIFKEEYRNGEWYSTDVRLIRGDNIPKADCWCFGAPCQDFSIAGKRAGLSGDRSSLIREVFRILKEIPEENRPEWLIYENVKGMLSSNRGGDFGAILLEMGELGYDTEWQLFNTKNFGVPQNRERVYTVGHLRSRGRKQVFPLKGADGEDSIYEVKQIGQRNRPGRNNLNQYRVYDQTGIVPCLNKMDGGGREPNIPIPMCIGGIEKGTKKFGKQFAQQDRIYDGSQVATALTSQLSGDVNYYGIPIQSRTDVAIPVLTPDRPVKRQNGRRFKDNGDESFTLTAQDKHGVAIGIRYTEDGFHCYRNDKKKSSIQGTHVTYPEGKSHCISTAHIPMTMCPVKIREATVKGYAEAEIGGSVNLSMPESKTRRGRVGKKQAQTLDCACNQGILVKLSDDSTVYAVWYEKYQCYIAIRKLTPKECFRLQGWTDDYFEKAAFVNSDSQLYKQAGNGVTVDVVAEIARQLSLFEEAEYEEP